MNLNIKARLLAAIAQFKAEHDIRYYLNGVFVEPDPEGGVFIVATNGHMMGVWRDPEGVAERAAILRVGRPLQSACSGFGDRRSACFDDLLAALQAYEDAKETMFGQCCSNPIKDAWGREVSMAKFNDASFIAGKAIEKATNTTPPLPRQL